MYKFFIALCSLGLFSLSANTQAVNWEYIGTDSQDNKFYVDTDSLKRYGSEVTAWDKQVLNKPDKASNGKLYSVLKYQRKYDCSHANYTILYVVVTTKNGTVVDSVNIPSYYQERQPIIPDTMGEAGHNFVCSYGQ